MFAGIHYVDYGGGESMSDRLKAPMAARDPICIEPKVTKPPPRDGDETNGRLVRLVEALRAAGYECELNQESLH
jgi:hypothetical protein